MKEVNNIYEFIEICKGKKVYFSKYYDKEHWFTIKEFSYHCDGNYIFEVLEHHSDEYGEKFHYIRINNIDDWDMIESYTKKEIEF